MADEEECNTGLGLGLSVGRYYLPKGKSQKDSPPPPCLDLSVALCPREGAPKVDSSSSRTMEEEEDKKRDCKNNSKNISGRKKLRLTKEQSSLLENSFKLHTTLNPAKKQALAEQLNLKPRQVEVWFQNRRARTKLKQTEVDCEFLKKCCESLSEENRRLKKELQELRSLKAAAPPPLFIQIPKATTLSMCPSCEKIEGKPDVVLKNNK
ncbi:hypothetical protein SLEP1_g30658 [Rubroshorea leprosula]|uniref:Homeobox domain-containing protein n=1 Tax=Rubroshorea leprosula TaxID=152421 RepID=A0AAV5K911_9ROSI|nr:hypothetical protein SLEP1_g30658 [Rubroshorea leprosula]